jgi:putative membrane protein
VPEKDRHRRISRAVVIQDRLAMDLTSLSNERTLLNYVRTALAFLASGVALIHFFEAPGMVIIGWALLPLGVACAIFGILRFNHVRKILQQQWHMRSMEDDELEDEE